LGKKIIDEFKLGFSSVQLEEKYRIDNDTILRFVKKILKKDEFESIEKQRINQHM
jgi:hypothetical protein